MSRTYTTAPRGVQLAQDPRKRRAEHKHGLHDCNLPTQLDPHLRWGWGLAVRCGAPCQWVAARSCRALAWHCNCSWCAYRGATPPRTLRRRIHTTTARAALRAPDEYTLDEIDDRATPRR